ncbi:MAG: RecX family transcriptional regulator [Clostridia bacterium]|nr:RecX family transcriptional regulator [Clostridia bacterium]
MEYIEEFDKLKTKVLKYILFKKRTEQEIRQKFKPDTGELLDNVIQELKNCNYINDEQYVKKTVDEYMNLKSLSIKEIEYKLISKGIKKSIINNFIYSNKEELLQYEIKSATNILNKKESNMNNEDIVNYLKKKGYMEESLKIAIQNKEE